MEKSDLLERLHQADSKESGELFRNMLRASVRQALHDLVEQEIESLCGPKHQPQEGSTYYRSGNAQSHVYLDGRKTLEKRPRVRRKTGEEDGRIPVHAKLLLS